MAARWVSAAHFGCRCGGGGCGCARRGRRAERERIARLPCPRPRRLRRLRPPSAGCHIRCGRGTHLPVTLQSATTISRQNLAGSSRVTMACITWGTPPSTPTEGSMPMRAAAPQGATGTTTLARGSRAWSFKTVQVVRWTYTTIGAMAGKAASGNCLAYRRPTRTRSPMDFPPMGLIRICSLWVRTLGRRDTHHLNHHLNHPPYLHLNHLNRPTGRRPLRARELITRSAASSPATMGPVRGAKH